MTCKQFYALVLILLALCSCGIKRDLSLPKDTDTKEQPQ